MRLGSAPPSPPLDPLCSTEALLEKHQARSFSSSQRLLTCRDQPQRRPHSGSGFPQVSVRQAPPPTGISHPSVSNAWIKSAQRTTKDRLSSVRRADTSPLQEPSGRVVRAPLHSESMSTQSEQLSACNLTPVPADKFTVCHTKTAEFKNLSYSITFFTVSVVFCRISKMSRTTGRI